MAPTYLLVLNTCFNIEYRFTRCPHTYTAPLTPHPTLKPLQYHLHMLHSPAHLACTHPEGPEGSEPSPAHHPRPDAPLDDVLQLPKAHSDHPCAALCNALLQREHMHFCGRAHRRARDAVQLERASKKAKHEGSSKARCRPRSRGGCT